MKSFQSWVLYINSSTKIFVLHVLYLYISNFAFIIIQRVFATNSVADDFLVDAVFYL